MEDLAHAFMKAPDMLGARVGMKRGPVKRFPNFAFRLEYQLSARGLIYAEVQPFPYIPAPTYLVVLGRCKNLRTWRRIISRASQGIIPLTRRKSLVADDPAPNRKVSV